MTDQPATPPVEDHRVEVLREALLAGAVEIDAAALARAMMDSDLPVIRPPSQG